MKRIATLVTFVVLGALSSGAHAAPIPFSIGGDNTPASIDPTVTAFQSALGDPNNGNAPGPLASGRREINWDGGGATNNTVSGTPFDGFLNIRGARFVTPGTGFVQAPPSGGADNGLVGQFGNATYATTFTAFSPVRLFTPIDSTVTDVLFFIPGSGGATSATVGGFGAVFTDVDLAGSATLDYFDVGGSLLFSQSVPPGTVPSGSLSFAGVVFDAGEQIGRVRITSGNTALGETDGGLVDVVVLDDFLYREPQAVPEPAALLLIASGFGGVVITAWRRRRLA